MNEHAILFSGPMVLAIIEGRKTQTRRVVVPQPTPPPARAEPWGNGTNEWVWTSNSGKVGIFRPYKALCPFGIVGHRLWVRETWGTATCNRGTECAIYRADETLYHALRDMEGEGDLCGTADECTHGQLSSVRWKPSIHMPRWASRLTLEITDVRVQRVCEISEEDAVAEGCQHHESAIMSMAIGHRATFRELWDSINAKRGFGWDTNPWVWALTFKVVK